MSYHGRRHRNVARLLISTSSLVLAATSAAYAATQTAATEAQPVSENVVITGSLIRGEAPVGLDLSQLTTMDFVQSGAVTTADLFKKLPAVFVINDTQAARTGNPLKVTGINIHDIGYIDTLLLFDDMRVPLESTDITLHDPSIVPSISLGTVDIFNDGASATYGTDAIAGVVNLKLKRGFDGAVTQLHYGYGDGASQYSVDQLFGRKWSSGSIVVGFEYYNKNPVLATSLPREYTSDITNLLAPGIGPNGAYSGANMNLLNNSAPATIVIPTGTYTVGTINGAPSTRAISSTLLAPSSQSFPSILIGNQTCANCFSVPSGQDGGYSTYNRTTNTVGNPLNFSSITASPTAANRKDGDSLAWATPQQQRSGLTVAFDQDVVNDLGGVIKDVHFFGDFLYSNRQGRGVDSTTNGEDMYVPSSNPYYPVGAPSQGMRVEYNLDWELHPINTPSEVVILTNGGFDFSLPADWHGRLTYSATSVDSKSAQQGGTVNPNALQAALGLTVTTTAGAILNGVVLPQFTYIKPASVPYLNVFCDPTSGLTCNDPATLAYISGFDTRLSHVLNHEMKAVFDGTVVSLPGGDAKLAVGGDYYHETYHFNEVLNTTTQAPNLYSVFDAQTGRESYALFGQLDVPVVGDMNAFPGVKKLDISIAGRFDHYSDFGGTTNPSVRADWEVIDGVTFRGSWSTGFRAPTLQDTSPSISRNVRSSNGAVPATPSDPACDAVFTSPLFLNTPCNGSTSALRNLGILIIGPGGAGELSQAPGNATCVSPFLSPTGNITTYTITIGLCTRQPGSKLGPETSTNYSFGIKIAPPQIAGLDIDIGYFNVVVNNELVQPNGPVLTLQQYQPFFTYKPDAAKIAYILNVIKGNDGTPTTKAIYILDQSVYNAGPLYEDGIDFRASYTRDFGHLGIWNAGISGTWYNTYNPTLFTGQPETNCSPPASANNSAPCVLDTNAGANRFPAPLRMQGRGQIGWMMDEWNVNLFANYQSSFGLVTTLANTPGGYAAGFQKVAAQTTFDLSVGYDLGDTPSNEYLKGISFQFTINNIFNKYAPLVVTGSNFEYQASLSNPLGRLWGFTITKTF